MEAFFVALRLAGVLLARCGGGAGSGCCAQPAAALASTKTQLTEVREEQWAPTNSVHRRGWPRGVGWWVLRAARCAATVCHAQRTIHSHSPTLQLA